MKRFLKHTPPILIICLICFPARAAAQLPDGAITVSAVMREVKVAGDSLLIDAEITIEGFRQSPLHEVILTPVISGERNRCVLPPVVLSGKRRGQLNQRRESLRRPQSPAPYARFTTGKKEADYTIDYRVATAFEAWMTEAALLLFAENCGCGNTENLPHTLLAEHILAPRFEFNPAVCFIVPKEKKLEQRIESIVASITFEAGNGVFRPGFDNNETGLEAIRRILEDIQNKPGAVITSVYVTAYASPEGRAAYNLALSEQRAATLTGYLMKACGFPDGVVHFEGMGEDWTTLEKMITGDGSLDDKEHILHIIATVADRDNRERQLKTAAGAETYGRLFASCYPKLRRGDCEITYTIPPIDIEKGKEALRLQPEILHPGEIHRIAATYEQGSAPFLEVYDIAVRLYPKDRIVRLNAAAGALLRKDTRRAGQLLKGYENDPDSWNSFGIFHALLNQYEEAERYFVRAAEEGSEQARENLLQLEELRRDGIRYTLP